MPYERDPLEAEAGGPSAVLLSGLCRLSFEGQSFVPDGEPTRECWLEVSEAADRRLTDMLGPDWNREFDKFHAEFWGLMRWTPAGSGHFNMSKSFARLDELVSARIIPPPPSPPQKKYNSIQARLEAGRSMKRQTKD